MKIYFLSAIPCALSLNGVYFGLTDRFERFAEVHLADHILAEFLPENAQPIRFFITESLPSAPPQGCEVYLLPDGLAIFARDFPSADTRLRIIAQRRFDTGLVTVFSQGGVQVSIQTQAGFFVSYLPPSFSSCELSCHEGLFFLNGQNCLAVYTKTGRQVLLEEVDSFTVEGTKLRAILPLADGLERKAHCVWELNEEGCIRESCALTQSRACELLPYSFFQTLLFGGDYASFLADDLQPKANELVDFLGNFKGVTPTDDPLVCRLIYPKGERLYEARDFTVCIEQGKITDITG